MNRETWLQTATEELKELFGRFGYELPEVHVSAGFPSKGGMSTKKRVLGECWKPAVSADGQSHIFINPMMDSSVDVLGVLIHELIHAWDKGESGHRGAFVSAAKDLGLVGPWTATSVGEELRERLDNLIETIGQYPHSKLNPNLVAKKAQSTRMLKTECAEGSGYIARLTKKWVEEYGTPLCPCHQIEMELEVKE